MSERIEDIAIAMTAGGKGLLAADESTSTIKKRFDTIKLESTEENRRDYREMLFTTKEAMEKYISGVILFDETIRQKASDGRMLTDIIKAAGSIPGIKVDEGAKPLAGFPDETITEGLDGLRGRLKEYYELGARFAKWRGVISIDKSKLPSWGAVRQNAQALARYAALCQEAQIVPIVEPEILMDGKPGDHSIDRCYEVTEHVLRTVFDELFAARVKMEGMILKPNMVIDGKKARKASVEEVAAHLSAINAIGNLPWKVTFSYGRALQAAAIEAWGGKKQNVAAGQRAFAHRAKMNYLAALGKWTPKDEKAA